MYQSKAALRRRRKRLAYVKVRNDLVRYGGVIVMGMIGIVLGLWIVVKLMPDHPWFQ